MGDIPRERDAVLRGLPQLAPGLYAVELCWLYGTAPNARFKSEVRDPPCNGWGTALLLDREQDDRGKPMKMVTLFALSWFDSWQVSRRCTEYQSIRHPYHHRLKSGELRPDEAEERSLAYYREALPRMWATVAGFGWTGKDFDTAAAIMRKLGLDVPLVLREDGEETRVSGGKEVAVGLTKPVKRASRKGQVLSFFWPETKSIREAMAEFGITRSNVLSQLYLLQKDHGIGYELKGDAAIITMPQGCDNPWTEE